MNPDDIRALRKARGWTTRKLAEALGLEPSVVLAWEAGERFPTRKAIDKMQQLASSPAPGDRGSTTPAPWEAFRDPGLWTLIRKLAAHPALRHEVEQLAARFDDPAAGSD